MIYTQRGFELTQVRFNRDPKTGEPKSISAIRKMDGSHQVYELWWVVADDGWLEIEAADKNSRERGHTGGK